jgi:hypothetical protein
MMTDQFSIELRRHLVEAADERPSEGQLEAVLRRTATERQLAPWVAGLRLRARRDLNVRVGWQLRYVLIGAALLIAAALVVVLGGGSQSAGRTVFEGRWTSADTVDDSTQTLVVDAGLDPDVHLEDDFSVNCERRGDSSTLYIADGLGEVNLNRLTVSYASGGCSIRLGPYEAFYDYDSATDTLVDYQDTTWTRVR